MKIEQINRYIDHTLLKPEATFLDICSLCDEAKLHKFYAVCVNPIYVPIASKMLSDGYDTKICTVIGFPLGASTTDVKVFEALQAVDNGAQELDVVMNIGRFQAGLLGSSNDEPAGRFKAVVDDIQAIVERVKQRRIVVKVILETSFLRKDEELKMACEMAKKTGADFVKTSTGFSSMGATLGDVSLMREFVGSDMGVKASGGIKDLTTAVAMIGAGANRIGTSSGVEIVKEAARQKS